MRANSTPFARALLALVAGSFARADDGISFQKTRLDDRFHAEGVAAADIDGDGWKDIVAGALWYRAPEWTPNEIAPVREFIPEKGYSDAFCCFTEDLDGDDDPDVIVVGFPAHAVRVYTNPGRSGLDRHWAVHEGFPSCSNESPAWTDLTGDGRREIVCGFKPENRMGWFAPTDDPSAAWATHPFSGANAPGSQQFDHGLGVGDVDLDGRLDVITRYGWYAGSHGVDSWKFHEAPLGEPCSHMYVEDFDGDGDMDILSSSAHDYGIWWHEQRESSGGRAWTTHLIDDSFSQTHALVLADINKDGLPDFVTGKRWYAHQGRDPGGKEPAVLYWFELARAEGRPYWRRHLIDRDSGVGTQFVVTDMNRDQLDDIIVANKRGVFFFEQKRAFPSAGR